MTSTLTISDANNTAFTAYIASRAAQDHVSLSTDAALAELLMQAGINQAGTSSGPAFKPSGNRFGN